MRWVIVDEMRWRLQARLGAVVERLAARSPAAPAHRPLRDAAAARGGRRVPRRPGRQRARPRARRVPCHRRCRGAQAARSRSWCRSRTWAGSARPSRWRNCPAVPRPRASSGPASGPRCTPTSHSRLIRSHRNTSCSPTAGVSRSGGAQALKLAEEDLVRAHHGSLAREQRLLIEQMLKEGCPPSSPTRSSWASTWARWTWSSRWVAPPVARGLQRIGRAGHHGGEPSKGVLFPKYRGSLLETAVVTRLMHEASSNGRGAPQPARRARAAVRGRVRRARLDRRRAVRDDPRCRERLARARDVRCRAGDARGQYLDEFAELDHAVLDRVAGTLRSRGDAGRSRSSPAARFPSGACSRSTSRTTRRARMRTRHRARAAHSGGRRGGELDEEMVYGARGEVILLGASAWRIESIGHDRVTVSPAPGEPGKVPFWKGDQVGRPAENWAGSWARSSGPSRSRPMVAPRGVARRSGRCGSTTTSTTWRRATCSPTSMRSGEVAAAAHGPDHRAQRFRDELGDWRVVLLSPFGAWCTRRGASPSRPALGSDWGRGPAHLVGRRHRHPAASVGDDTRLGSRGHDDETGWAAPGSRASPGPRTMPCWFPRTRWRSWWSGRSARPPCSRAGSRERGTALLLPHGAGRGATPLWQMRQRASQLLAVASRYGSFPIVLETYRGASKTCSTCRRCATCSGAIERREVRS